MYFHFHKNGDVKTVWHPSTGLYLDYFSGENLPLAAAYLQLHEDVKALVDNLGIAGNMPAGVDHVIDPAVGLRDSIIRFLHAVSKHPHAEDFRRSTLMPPPRARGPRVQRPLRHHQRPIDHACRGRRRAGRNAGSGIQTRTVPWPTCASNPCPPTTTRPHGSTVRPSTSTSTPTSTASARTCGNRTRLGAPARPRVPCRRSWANPERNARSRSKPVAAGSARGADDQPPADEFVVCGPRHSRSNGARHGLMTTLSQLWVGGPIR